MGRLVDRRAWPHALRMTALMNLEHPPGLVALRQFLDAIQQLSLVL